MENPEVRIDTCYNCGGAGYVYGAAGEMHNCPVCDGRGKTVDATIPIENPKVDGITCPSCGGVGRIAYTVQIPPGHGKCSRCQGTGIVLETDPIPINPDRKKRIEEAETLADAWEAAWGRNPVNPSHYSEGMPDGVQVRDVLKAQGIWEEACRANVIKYILRAEYKNGLEDYKKAAQYLEWLIEEKEASA